MSLKYFIILNIWLPWLDNITLGLLFLIYDLNPDFLVFKSFPLHCFQLGWSSLYAENSFLDNSSDRSRNLHQSSASAGPWSLAWAGLVHLFLHNPPNEKVRGGHVRTGWRPEEPLTCLAFKASIMFPKIPSYVKHLSFHEQKAIT